MKLKKLFIIFTTMLLFACNAWSTNYYVDADTDAVGDGSIGNPWDEVSDVNAVDFNGTHTIYFDGGDVWNEQLNLDGIVTNPSGTTITIDAYGSGTPSIRGVTPYVTGSTYRPVLINNIGLNIVINNMDFSGQMWLDGINKQSAVELEDLGDVTIDGITMDGSLPVYTPSHWPSDGSERFANGLNIDDAIGSIILRNSTIKNYGDESNWDTPASPDNLSTDYICVVIQYNQEIGETIIINDNVISGCESDGIQIYESTTPATVYNNDISNCGENCIDNKDADDTEYYHNKFYRSNYTGWHGDSPALWQAIGSVGMAGSDNVVLRDNYFGASDTYAIKLGSDDITRQVTGIEIYGNSLMETVYNHYYIGVYTQAEIHHNIHGSFTNYHMYLSSGKDDGVRGEDYIKYYFNSLYHTTEDVGTAFYIDRTTGLTDFAANIIRVEDSNAILFRWTDIGGTGDPTFSEPNIWYNLANTGDMFNWSGTPYDAIGDWNTATGGTDTYEDPKFNSTTDLTLQVSSPAINVYDLSSLTTTSINGKSLLPTSIWEFGNFNIFTGDQSDYGSNDEPGAFLYDSLPIIPGLPFTNYGADTRGPYTNLEYYKSSTIAFVASTLKITDSNSQFVIEGFIAGDTIEVSGTSNNDGLYLISSVIASEITLVSASSLTNENAGSSFTIQEQPTIFIVEDNAFTDGTPVDDTRSGIPVKRGDIKEAIKLASNKNGNIMVFFEDSGVVNLAGENLLVCESSGDYCTSNNVIGIGIYGQTAPDPGFAVRSGQIKVWAQHGIIQHISSWSSDEYIANSDCFALDDPEDCCTGENTGTCTGIVSLSSRNPIYMGSGNAENFIIDHCSFLWGPDENMGMGKTNTILYRSLMAESLDIPNGENSKSLLISGGGLSNNIAIENIIVSAEQRNPAIISAVGVQGDIEGFAFVNNYIYNMGYQPIWIEMFDDELELSMVNNVYDVGPDTWTDAQLPSRSPYSYFAVVDDLNGDGSNSKLYFSGNKTENETQSSSSDWDGVADYWTGDPTLARVTTSPGYPTGLAGNEISVGSLKSNLVANIGSRPWNRNDQDQRIIDYINNAPTGGPSNPLTSQDDIISGVWPTLDGTYRYLDDDMGPNPLPSDPHGDDDSDGYTNIEEWIHEFPYADTFYVDADITDCADYNPSTEVCGTGSSQAWDSLSDINNYAEGVGFNDGDIISLNRGDTWNPGVSTEETIGDDGTDINWGTIDGLTFNAYGTGANPMIDTQVAPAFKIIGGVNFVLKNITIKDIDINGSDNNVSNIYINRVDGVIVDGIDGNGRPTQTGTSPNIIKIQNSVGDIEVKNCNLDDWGPIVNPTTSTEDTIAIYIWNSYIADENNTSTSMGTSTLTRSGAGWSTNEWNGYYVLIDDENNNCTGDYREILSNTSDTLTVASAWTNAPCTSLNNYQIVDAVQWAGPSSIKIHDNTVYEMNSDAVQVGRFLGTSYDTGSSMEIYNNTFYDCGEEPIDIKASKYTKIYGNTLYRNGWGQGGTGGSGPLITMHTSSTWYGLKCDYMRIYENKFDGNIDDIGEIREALKVSTDNNLLEIFNNEIINCGPVFLAFGNNLVYNNIIKKTNTNQYVDSGSFLIRIGSYEQTNTIETKIYNNTLYASSDSYTTRGISTESTGIITIKNNLIQVDRSGAYPFYSRTNPDTPVFDYNTFHNATDNTRVYYNSIAYDNTEEADYRIAVSSTNGEFRDPKFESVGSNQLWLASDSDDINAGTTITETANGIDISSSWPDSVSFVVRADNDGTDRGAYEYTPADTTPPDITSPLPSGVQACTSDPRDIDISITTDENATCKYSLTNVAYDSMASTFSTTGSTNHSQTISSLACDDSYTYYTRCEEFHLI